MDLNQLTDVGMKVFGTFIVVGVIGLLLKDASKFNSIANTFEGVATTVNGLG